MMYFKVLFFAIVCSCVSLLRGLYNLSHRKLIILELRGFISFKTAVSLSCVFAHLICTVISICTGMNAYFTCLSRSTCTIWQVWNVYVIMFEDSIRRLSSSIMHSRRLIPSCTGLVCTVNTIHNDNKKTPKNLILTLKPPQNISVKYPQVICGALKLKMKMFTDTLTFLMRSKLILKAAAIHSPSV